MKPAAILVVVTILAILVIAEVIALADTNSFPPVICAAPIPENVTMAENVSLYTRPEAPLSGQPLPPGIYETRPFAMMLKVPELTADNCVIHVGTPPPMPERHPELQVIPNVAPASEAKK